MTTGVWDRVDVSHWVVLSFEVRGTSETLWLEEPDTGWRWLHKDTHIPTNGVEQGEDWSEIVSTQVGALLGVPCAQTRMCTRHGRRGSVSLDVKPDGYALNEGYVVLTDADAPGYIRHTEDERARDPARPEVKRPGHSLENIRAALQGVTPPPGFAGPDTLTGFDVFSGYMIFDALVANQDRHEENWAVLTPPLTSSPVRLSPSYDHASSLGFNITEAHREACLNEPGRLQKWAENGRAGRFEHVGRPSTLVEHAANAVAMSSSDGAHWWHERLDNVDLESVLRPLRERIIPGMSDLAAKFAHDLLELNLRRLRDAIHTCA